MKNITIYLQNKKRDGSNYLLVVAGKCRVPLLVVVVDRYNLPDVVQAHPGRYLCDTCVCGARQYTSVQGIQNGLHVNTI
jgi:hypothetical protein